MTMGFVFALVGLILGGAIGELGGALGGAALGYAAGLHIAFKRRFDDLEAEVTRLAEQRVMREAPPPVPVRPWTRESAPSGPRDYFETGASSAAPAVAPAAAA